MCSMCHIMFTEFFFFFFFFKYKDFFLHNTPTIFDKINVHFVCIIGSKTNKRHKRRHIFSLYDISYKTVYFHRITKCQALHWSRRKDIYSYIPIDRNAIAPWNCVIGEHPISTLTLKDDDLFLITDTLGNISDLSCRLGEIEDSVLSAKIWPCSAMFSGYFADQSARCGGAVVLCAVWKISKKMA